MTRDFTAQASPTLRSLLSALEILAGMFEAVNAVLGSETKWEHLTHLNAPFPAVDASCFCLWVRSASHHLTISLCWRRGFGTRLGSWERNAPKRRENGCGNWRGRRETARRCLLWTDAHDPCEIPVCSEERGTGNDKRRTGVRIMDRLRGILK